MYVLGWGSRFHFFPYEYLVNSMHHFYYTFSNCFYRTCILYLLHSKTHYYIYHSVNNAISSKYLFIYSHVIISIILSFYFTYPTILNLHFYYEFCLIFFIFTQTLLFSFISCSSMFLSWFILLQPKKHLMIFIIV